MIWIIWNTKQIFLGAHQASDLQLWNCPNVTQRTNLVCVYIMKLNCTKPKRQIQSFFELYNKSCCSEKVKSLFAFDRCIEMHLNRLKHAAFINTTKYNHFLVVIQWASDIKVYFLVSLVNSYLFFLVAQ